MSFAVVAFHHPHDEQRDELRRRIGEAAAAMRATAGCLLADCWHERETGALVSVGVFESEAAWHEALAAVVAAGVDFGYDEREARPRDVHFLVG